MDLTTLAMALALLLASLGLDTVMHPRDVLLDGQVTARLQDTSFNEEMLTDILREEVERISSTPSVSSRPVIQVGRPEGFGVSIAEAMHVPGIAYALQSQFGTRPDQIRLGLYVEGGVNKILVRGFGQRHFASFRQEVTQEPDESIVALAHRASIIAMAQVDPYSTALNLMQRHIVDLQFHDAEAIIAFGVARSPQTPVNAERALFENLEGIIALFRKNLPQAQERFQRAMRSNPANPVAAMNAAFVLMAMDRDADAVTLMQALLRNHPPADPDLLGTAYMTLGAALLGVGKVQEAEAMTMRAVGLHPTCSTARELWSEVKRVQGDAAAAERMHQEALSLNAAFENYAEVAVLYFRMGWRDGEPVMRSPFSNPTIVPVRGRLSGRV
ncbi:MAG: tetratricopeptide repeat protein [Acetobacteraceae bacterium]